MSLDIELGTRTITRVKRIRGIEVRLDPQTDQPRIAIFLMIGYRDESNNWMNEKTEERYLSVEQSQYVLGLKSADLQGVDLPLAGMLERAVIGIETGQIVLPEPPAPEPEPAP